jgi:DNA-binding NarL/FixJ family response regulator
MALTPRELQVLQALANGVSRQEIATRMGVQVGTVYRYIWSATWQLCACSVEQAIAIAISQKLIMVEEIA